METVPLTGRVVSAGGAPLVFAQVAIPSLLLVTQSRDDGHFTLNIPAAKANGQTVVMTFRALGYKQTTVSVALTPPIAPVNVVLETNPLHLGEFHTIVHAQHLAWIIYGHGLHALAGLRQNLHQVGKEVLLLSVVVAEAIEVG